MFFIYMLNYYHFYCVQTVLIRIVLVSKNIILNSKKIELYNAIKKHF